MRALQTQHAEALSALAGGGEMPPPDAAVPAAAHAALMRGGAPARGAGEAPVPPPPPVDLQGTFVRGERKIGRNEPCPCGSGKKYKHCHGALSSVE